jgi:imidazolonepropionase-like amidohydrolase
VRRRIFPGVLFSLSIFCHLLVAAEDTESLVIRAGRIWTATDSVIADGVIIVKDGKIRAVGKQPNVPAEAKILDMPDKDVIPGLIDAHCHLGLSSDIFAEIDETVSAVTPDMQILDAFDPLADSVEKTRSSGVTTVMLAPGSKNPIAGQTAIVKLYGSKMNDWVLKRRGGVKFSLRDEALMADRRPTSRAGLMALLREQLDKAKAYKDDARDPCAKVLKRVADGNLPAHICAYTVDEIASAITLVDEYRLNAVLIGAEKGDEIADMVAERDIPVIYAPLLLFSKDKDLKRVGKIANSGIKLAFSSAYPRTALGDLRTSAILATRYGVSPEVALKSLTIHAAEILGIADRVGSIEKGKDADLVILNGEPLQLTSSVEMVIINGHIVYKRREE